MEIRSQGQSVLITGAAGNVGAYAVQMAVGSGIGVVAVARKRDEQVLRELGVKVIVDSDAPDFARGLPKVDAIVDLVGGETLQKSVGALKENGKLVSVVSDQIPMRSTGREAGIFLRRGDDGSASQDHGDV